jgi:hypothetical protein
VKLVEKTSSYQAEGTWPRDQGEQRSALMGSVAHVDYDRCKSVVHTRVGATGLFRSGHGSGSAQSVPARSAEHGQQRHALRASRLLRASSPLPELVSQRARQQRPLHTLAQLYPIVRVIGLLRVRHPGTLARTGRGSR